jgi:methylthioribose-1-phosphate isomerase
MIDQTLLPGELKIIDCKTIPEVCEAIKSLRVRGAPAIGCAAAFGYALAAAISKAGGRVEFVAELHAAKEALAATRPTAVNLFWALERMARTAERALAALPQATSNECAWRKEREQIVAGLIAEAKTITEDDLHRCIDMGRHGAELIPEGANILTHCNAGALATAGYGTALGVIRAAHEAGKRIHVWVDETRPLLQGARLTAWELVQEGIPCTVICDNMSASLMRAGRIDCAVVGADRIAANGDFANKIGTYAVAVLAHHHDIPLYVAAPISTVDYALPDGGGIPIEERKAEEVSMLAGLARTAACPADAAIYNPAFDVTPAELVAAIVTEKGVARRPFGERLEEWRKGS